mgnify:FL=1
MQTFLPYKDFKESLNVLDNKRLGKQRSETYHILNILLQRTDKKGYANHPIVHMWRGHETALQEYFNVNTELWLLRGFRHTMGYEIIDTEVKYPTWLGDKRFHQSHRANLLRKDSEYYSKFGWTEEQDIPYVWLDTDKNQWFFIHPLTKKRNYITDGGTYV